MNEIYVRNVNGMMSTYNIVHIVMRLWIDNVIKIYDDNVERIKDRAP